MYRSRPIKLEQSPQSQVLRAWLTVRKFGTEVAHCTFRTGDFLASEVGSSRDPLKSLWFFVFRVLIVRISSLLVSSRELTEGGAFYGVEVVVLTSGAPLKPMAMTILRGIVSRASAGLVLPVGSAYEGELKLWRRGVNMQRMPGGENYLLQRSFHSGERLAGTSIGASVRPTWSGALATVQLLDHDAGTKAEERVEAALTDFILDGARTTTIAHRVWQSVVRAGDTVIDATCGNGHDTLMLAKLVLQEGTAGCVVGLDLQQSALDNTAALLHQELKPHQREKVNLLLLCHSQLDKVVDEGSVRLVAFNLGYQPGGDKSFITTADSTVRAIEAATKVLEPQGIISIMSYVGHPGGQYVF